MGDTATDRGTMVERVAAELAQAIGSPMPYRHMPDEMKAVWRSHARAAINAIAEHVILRALED